MTYDLVMCELIRVQKYKRCSLFVTATDPGIKGGGACPPLFLPNSLKKLLH